MENEIKKLKQKISRVIHDFGICMRALLWWLKKVDRIPRFGARR
jgi:hypothetical protein